MALQLNPKKIGWLQAAWTWLPEEEQKLIAGFIVVLGASGAISLESGGHIVISWLVVKFVLARYVADHIVSALTPDPND